MTQTIHQQDIARINSDINTFQMMIDDIVFDIHDVRAKHSTICIHHADEQNGQCKTCPIVRSGHPPCDDQCVQTVDDLVARATTAKLMLAYVNPDDYNKEYELLTGLSSQLLTDPESTSNN